MQAVSVGKQQPALHTLHKLLARLATGQLRGGFTANGCVIRPVVSSKGRVMQIAMQHVPESGASPAARRRHQ